MLSRRTIRRENNFMNKKTVTYQLHTRRLDREVAHNKMKKADVIQPNKDKGNGSFFARHWREYV